MRPVSVSFEFFPPNDTAMEQTLWASIQRLAPLAPRFVSVTYGADGSTRERTHNVVTRILRETPLTPAPHLTCIGSSRGAVLDVNCTFTTKDGAEAQIQASYIPPAFLQTFVDYPPSQRPASFSVDQIREEVDKQIPLKGRRWVVSHVNVISPRDIERIARMGLVLTTHTNAYLYKALETTASKLKPEQYDDIVPMNALREAGVTVSLATDNVPISLWYPVAQTVARKDFKTKRMFGEKQALSRMNALRAATATGAYLTFDEAKKGSLEAGKYADLAVLSADPLTVAEDKLADMTAQMTMIGGRIVHEMLAPPI